MATNMVIKRNANVANINAGIAEETLFFSGDEANADFVMDISAENTSAILNELTDLSSNPGAYAIREAYSNAYDAVAATGDMTRGIEVVVPRADDLASESLAYKLCISECPSELLSYATVTDHGIGMTPDDLRKFFTQYGGTKKQGAGLIGSKGLGSKAPLSCSDFFDVVTCKDGTRSIAHLWRGNGHNYAKLVKVEPTSEPDGTTIRIPVVDPKVAAEMDACMSEIAKWNLDANLTYNGEHYDSFLTEGVSEDGKGGYVFLGNVKIGVDEDGKDVRVRMWQSIGSFPGRLVSRSLYGGSSNWNLRVDLNLCGVRYALTHGGYSRENMPDLVVAGDPGYLNFTPSRDEVKDDDSKKAFLDAVSAADYDASAVAASLFSGRPYSAVAKTLVANHGYISDNSSSLFFSGEKIGKVDVASMTSFDGTDMSDYLVSYADHHAASKTRYYAMTKLSGQGYLRPSADVFGTDGICDSAIAYDTGSGIFTARDIASRMVGLRPLPLCAIIPSPAFDAVMCNRWGGNAAACRAILNGGNNCAVVITGKLPSWSALQNRDSSIRKLVAERTGKDMKSMTVTYLFAAGHEQPTDSDLMALGIFDDRIVTTWDELVEAVRSMNRASVSSRKQASARPTRVGSWRTLVYDLTTLPAESGKPSRNYADAIEGLLGEHLNGSNVLIDFDADDLSDYVFAIGDGGTPEEIAHLAVGMCQAGLLGGATKLGFVSTSAAATKNYALNVNEVKTLMKSRNLRIFGDFRANGSRIPGIIDEVAGITAETKGGKGSYQVTGRVSLGSLGLTEPTTRALAYILRKDPSFRLIADFLLNCRNILGTTFCPLLDEVLAFADRRWWLSSARGTYYYRRWTVGIEPVAPDAWKPQMDELAAAVSVFSEIQHISGVESLISAANHDNDLARELIISGLESIVKSRIA